MTPKYTPAPWQAGKYSSIVGVPITAQPDKTKNTMVIVGTQQARSKEEAIANANLIAAAPELLEALEAVNKEIYATMGSTLTEDRYFKLRELCCDAIAKAKGE